MFDCGEGTQHQLTKCKDVSMSKIEKIFITHLHGDHVFGLPGLMCTMSMMWQPPRVEPTSKCHQQEEAEEKPVRHAHFSRSSRYLEIYGPRPLAAYLRAVLSASESHFSFQYRVNEIVHRKDESMEQVVLHQDEVEPIVHLMESNGTVSSLVELEEPVQVRAAALRHPIASFGYVLYEPSSPGTLDVVACAKLKIPKGPLLAALKRGESVTFTDENGQLSTITPQQVVSDTVVGRTIVLLGDTSDSSNILPLTQDVHVLVHEATFDDAHQELALPRGHSTARMAGLFATKLNAKNLILTHFSARFAPTSVDHDPMVTVQQEAASVFSGSLLMAHDFLTVDLTKKKR